MDAYPNHQWQPWKFQEPLSPSYWNNAQHRCLFFEDAARQLGLKSLEDWYNVSKDQILSIPSAEAVLAPFKASLPNALAKSFVDHPWQLWRFQSGVPRKFWTDKSHRRAFFEFLAAKLGLSNFDDWINQLSVHAVTREGGGAMLLDYYDDSIQQALSDLFPEHKWQPWRFTNGPKHFASSLDDDQYDEYVRFLESKLGIISPDDWYRVSRAQLKTVPGGASLRTSTGSRMLLQSLRRLYPDHNWADSLDLGRHGAAQRHLRSVLQQLFPNEKIIENAQLTSVGLELDLFIPALSIAFEYQGEHHYTDSPLRQLPDADAEKAALVTRQGLHLIEIPYWWDGSMQTLKEIISKIRPDLFGGNSCR